MNLLTIFLIFLLHRPIPTSSTVNNHHHHHHHHHHHQHHHFTTKAWPLNKWAREAIQKAETKFQNVCLLADPDSNKGTENQKAIYIAVEILKHASPSFLNHDEISKDEDRLVKVGRDMLDLVDMASGDADVDKKEEMLRLELQNIVEQCDILALDHFEVSTVRRHTSLIQRLRNLSFLTLSFTVPNSLLRYQRFDLVKQKYKCQL